jgi:hypothetical protein
LRGVSKDGRRRCRWPQALSPVADPSRLAARCGEHLRMTPEFFASHRSSTLNFFRPYPRPPNLAYPARVLSNEGRFLEAILQRTERKLAGPGRPGTVDGLVAGGALGGAAPSLGRARLPCRARWVHPPPQGCPLVPWRLPPLHPLARLPRDWQTSDALRRENAELCPVIPGRSRSERTRNPEVKLGGPTPLDSGFAPRGAPRNDEWVAV